MRTVIYALLLTTSWISSLSATIPEPTLSLPTLPQQYLETQFQTIQQSFEQRAMLFLKGRPFQSWRANKPRKDILTEFDQLNEWRFYTWYVDPKAKTLISRTDFMVAQDLLQKDLYRKPAFIAFQYNQTDGTYNSSTIILNGFKFLALESPTPKTIRNFFLLLQNHRVNQLVRLSSTNAPQPYSPNPYPIHYYAIDTWAENHGINPSELLKLIQKVKKNADPNGLIACHSVNGAGRAGTFLAGFLLISEIDRQIASHVSPAALDISIEKIVMQLSLQRPYLVRKPEQYLTLYQLVDLYVKNLK